MNAHYRLKTYTTLAVIAVFAVSLAGCAGRQAFSRGARADLVRDYETAMTEYQTAMNSEPGNYEYRLRYEQARFNAAFEHFEAGRRAADRADYETARKEFARALEIDPTHALAEQQLAKVTEILTNRSQKLPEPEMQFERLRAVTRTDPSVQSQLEPRITGAIDIHMTQDSRVAFETLAQLAGFNIIFDPDFRGTRIPIDLNMVDIYEALDILALQTRSFWKPINRQTILVSPDNQTKRRDYDELVLKTIYLSNSVTSTEITEAITALRTLLNMRYLAQSTAMNAIIIRDTADRIAIAEKIIEDLDKAKAEVVVDATILEVDRNTLRTLGILPPTSTGLRFTTPGSVAEGETPANNAIPLRDLEAFNSQNFSFAIPETVARFLANSSNTRLLQNPRVRATDGKLASIRIGSQVPIASGSFQPAFVGATGTPVVNFQFVDVGVNLDITPRVLLNREISMTVMVQVRAQAGERNIGGVTQPVLTNRQVQHEIRLAEGETNILGGIISDADELSVVGIPGLKDIPVLKYLFSQETRKRDTVEIIIMLTPHIVRMPTISEINLRGLYTGSETIPRLRNSPNIPAIGTPAQTPGAAGPQTQPQPTLPPGGLPPAATPLPPGVTLTPPGGAAAPQPGATGAAAAQPVTPAPGAVRQTGSTISFSPAPAVLPPSGPTVLNIVGTGNDFYGVDLTLSFEPGAFVFREIRDGGFLSRDGQIVAFVQRQETESGTVRISVERPPGVAPVSGTGNLVTLVLERTQRAGDSTLRVTDFRIRDAQQNVSVGRPAEVRVSAP
jgi:general secretion pathway protein D